MSRESDRRYKTHAECANQAQLDNGHWNWCKRHQKHVAPGGQACLNFKAKEK